MSEPSPRPWRVSGTDACCVRDERGAVVASTIIAEDAALIVAAVNVGLPPGPPALTTLIAQANAVYAQIARAATCRQPAIHAADCRCGTL